MEVPVVTKLGDWTPDDRKNGTKSWHEAQLFLMCSAAHSSADEARQIASSHYKTITQRAAFYNWFDQIRILQKHEVLWPGTAWIVASQFARFDTISAASEFPFSQLPTFSPFPLNMDFIAPHLNVTGMGIREFAFRAYRHRSGSPVAIANTMDDLVAFANAGNKKIFEDIYSMELPAIFLRGLNQNPLIGKEAKDWDIKLVNKEQREIVEQVYIKHVSHGNKVLGQILNELLACEDFVRIDRYASGQLGLCRSGLDVTKSEDRVRYGIETVMDFYIKSAASGALREMRPRQEYHPVSPIWCMNHKR